MVNKVIVVGLDGATFDIINPLIKKGELPSFKKIIEYGSSGDLASVIPANSAPAWGSFSTGMNPGKHGVYYFTERVPGSYRLRFTHSITRTGKPLWILVNESGRKAGIINIPGTFPPDTVLGFMISGLDTPSEKCSFTWPENMYEELRRNVGEYKIEPEEARLVQLSDDHLRARFVKAIRDNISLQWRCAKYLIEKYSPEFFVIVFTATDRIQHRLWKYTDTAHPHYNKTDAELFKDAIPSVYRDLDAILGEVVNGMDDDTTLFVLSDHGMGIRSDKTIYPNRWLLSKGYLNLDTTRKGSNRLKGFALNSIKRLLNGVKRRMSLKQRMLLRRYFPGFLRQGNLFLEIQNIDWKRTRAYSNELMNAVWINLEGREPLGIVQPGDEYEALCEQIASELKGLKDPETGEPIVKEVYKSDELYHGSEIFKAPDLVIEWNNYTSQASFLSNQEEAEMFLSRLTPEETSMARMSQTSGEHKGNGIFLAYGKGIKSGNHVEKSRIIDVAPTVLYTFGEKIPVDMDGKVLEDIFTNDFLKNHKIEFYSPGDKGSYKPRETDISSDDEEKLKERLRSLGYI